MTVAAYPTAPHIEGVTFRHIVMPDDLPAMNRVANAMRAAAGESWITSDEEFENYYQNLSNCDPATDIVVVERDGRIVAYGRASWREELDGARYYEVTAFSDPDNANQLLEPVTAAVEARCREIAAGHPPGPRAFETEASDDDQVRVAVLAGRGYEPVRYAYLMVRPNLDDLADAPLPDGLDVRPVTPDQLRTIFDAEVEAFRDHWGASVPMEADFIRFATDPMQSDTTLWNVAWDGDHVAGMVRGYINPRENEHYGRRRGWVENISVRRPWRRRGLARALIGLTIRALRERGMTEGALGVDTENPSGALRLYESCGFVATRREAVYRKPLE